MALETLEYDHTIHSTPNAGDESLLVKFFMDKLEDTNESKKKGRPIFKEVEWIDIRIPGSRSNVVVRPLREKDKQRFPQHYAAFRNRIEKGREEIIGTPLEIWPVITASQAAEFRFFNIHTVENLAAAPDELGQKFMGFQNIKAKAKSFLEAAKGTAPILKLQARMDKLEVRVNNLRAKNVRLRKKLKKAKDRE